MNKCGQCGEPLAPDHACNGYVNKTKPEGEISCPDCSRTFKSKSGLTLHMNAMHLTLSPRQLEQAHTSMKTTKNDSTMEDEEINQDVFVQTKPNSLTNYVCMLKERYEALQRKDEEWKEKVRGLKMRRGVCKLCKKYGSHNPFNCSSESYCGYCQHMVDNKCTKPENMYGMSSGEMDAFNLVVDELNQRIDEYEK